MPWPIMFHENWKDKYIRPYWRLGSVTPTEDIDLPAPEGPWGTASSLPRWRANVTTRRVHVLHITDGHSLVRQTPNRCGRRGETCKLSSTPKATRCQVQVDIVLSLVSKAHRASWEEPTRTEPDALLEHDQQPLRAHARASRASSHFLRKPTDTDAKLFPPRKLTIRKKPSGLYSQQSGVTQVKYSIRN